MQDQRFISYLRVSTKKQGVDGLGIDAQRAAVAAFVSSRSGLGEGERGTLLAEYLEAESGKNDGRPELAKALNHAGMAKATLVIAKLDRLSRDAHFLTGLHKAGVEFVACDMPYANKLTITIMAAIAEHERDMISQRTKAALSAKRAQGYVFKGRPGQRSEGDHAALALGRSKASTERRKAATTYASKFRDAFGPMREQGATLASIASSATSQGYRGPEGGLITIDAVSKLLRR